jgi:hypothetical protein
MRLFRINNHTSFPRLRISGSAIIYRRAGFYTAFSPPALQRERRTLIRTRLALAGEALGEEDFEQGLIGHVAAIREYLQVLDHGKRQAQGYGLESGLEADEFGALGGGPIEILGGIGGGPEVSLLVFGFECGEFFLGHVRGQEVRTAAILAQSSALIRRGTRAVAIARACMPHHPHGLLTGF